MSSGSGERGDEPVGARPVARFLRREDESVAFGVGGIEDCGQRDDRVRPRPRVGKPGDSERFVRLRLAGGFGARLSARFGARASHRAQGNRCNERHRGYNIA